MQDRTRTALVAALITTLFSMGSVSTAETLGSSSLPSSDLQDLKCATLLFENSCSEWKSRANLTRCIELYSKVAAHCQARAHSLELSGDIPGASEQFRVERSVNFRRAIALHNRAIAKQKTTLKGALEDHNKSIELFPDDNFLYHRANLKIKLKDYSGAVSDCIRALELNSNHISPLVTRARAHQLLGNIEAAVEDYTRAISACHTQSLGLNFPPAVEYVARKERGIALWHLKLHQKAIQDFEAAKSNEQSFFVRRTLGSMYADTGRIEAAVAEYSQALELNPSDAKAYFLRGQAQWMLGDAADAFSDFANSLRLNPINVALCIWSRDNARSLVGEQFRIEEPLIAHGFVESDEEQLWIDRDRKLTLLAANREYKGDHSGANAAWTDEISLYPSFPEPYFSRALYRMKIDPEQALQDLNKAIMLQPYNAAYFNVRAIHRWKRRDYLGSIADNLESIRLDLVPTFEKLKEHPLLSCSLQLIEGEAPWRR